LKNETVLIEAGDQVDRVYFPHSGIISLVVELSGGQAIEAAMIGRDSMFGATSARHQQI
jgi:CRP-like cAMP-binding protein